MCGSRIMNKNPLLFSDLSVTQEYQLEEVSATCKTFSILGFSFQPPDFFLCLDSLRRLRDHLIPPRSTLSERAANVLSEGALVFYFWSFTAGAKRGKGNHLWLHCITADFKQGKINCLSVQSPLLGKNKLTLTTKRAKRMTPQLQTSAFLPSYFSPWGPESVLLVGGVLALLKIRSRTLSWLWIIGKWLTLMTSGQA